MSGLISTLAAHHRIEIGVGVGADVNRTIQACDFDEAANIIGFCPTEIGLDNGSYTGWAEWNLALAGATQASIVTGSSTYDGRNKGFTIYDNAVDRNIIYTTRYFYVTETFPEITAETVTIRFYRPDNFYRIETLVFTVA